MPKWIVYETLEERLYEKFYIKSGIGRGKGGLRPPAPRRGA